MKGQNIICFAKDWSEDPTSNNHVMLLLAKENKVLWLNSIAMRTPTFSSGRDLGKIWRKLNSFFRGAEKAAPNLWVVTPIVLPFPHNKIAISINRWILRRTIGHYRRKLGLREFQLWTFLPNVVEYIGKLGESLVVYYCVDDWSSFRSLDGLKMSALEKQLMERADVCFMTAHSLLDAKKDVNPNSFLALHGVDYGHFVKAITPATETSTEIADLPHPIIGFFGLIDERFDLALIETLARMHPEWSIVIVGKCVVDDSALAAMPNVHLLGRRSYEVLPNYCRAFDVGIIPYKVNELTRNINPIKLREYISAGLPVVSTNLPEVRFYSDQAYIAHDYGEFTSSVERAIREDSSDARRRRSESMRNETWESRVAAVTDAVMKVYNVKLGRIL
jgi:glycosyltransferase involved in cell wall biosynthesis